MNNHKPLLQYTQSAKLEWKPLVEMGVNTAGIFFKALLFDEKT